MAAYLNRIPAWKTSLAVAALTAVSLPTDAGAQTANRLVTVVLSEEPDNIDGCNANRSATGRVVRNNIVEAMAEIDPSDGSVKPRLALSWERVNDTTWRFKLRQGVKFHDGAPFNAEAAVKGIARTMSPTSDCETRTRNFGTIKFAAKAVDEYTLEIVTEGPVPILPTYMATLMLVSPNQPMDKLASPVGAGPYEFVSWSAGQEIKAKRNENWWGGKPQVENVRYLFRRESNVRAAMVKVGEADLVPDIAVQDATEPTMDFSYLNSETSSLRIDALLPPLDDRRVRLALNYAVDRNAMRGSIFSKDVIPATQEVVPSIAGHNHELDKKVWPYDPAKAKQLLAEAKADGVPVDKEITMWGRLGLYPAATEVMEAFLGWYKAVGLNVKAQMLEVGEWRKLNVAPYPENRPPNLLQTQHDNNNGDPVFTVFFRYACKGSVSTYCDPKLDEEIVRAATLTGQERVDAWKELFRKIHEDHVIFVPMFHMVGYARVGSRINFKPTVATNSEVQISQITFK